MRTAYFHYLLTTITTIALWLLPRFSITSGEELTRGLEFISLKMCGPHTDKTAAVQLYPWPFIPSRKPFNMTVTFTPAVDIFAVTSEYEAMSEPGDQIIARGRDDMCYQNKNFCTIPAGETFVYKYTDIMKTFPPGFQMKIKATVNFFNEEQYVFFCVDFVARVH